MIGRILLYMVIYFLVSSVVRSIVRRHRYNKMFNQQTPDPNRSSRNKGKAEDADFEILDE